VNFSEKKHVEKTGNDGKTVSAGNGARASSMCEICKNR